VFKPRTLYKGNYLFKEGDTTIDGVHFIIEGYLERIKEDPYDSNENSHSARKAIPALKNKVKGVSLSYI
jgi:hypothetical protein